MTTGNKSILFLHDNNHYNNGYGSLYFHVVLMLDKSHTTTYQIQINVMLKIN